MFRKTILALAATATIGAAALAPTSPPRTGTAAATGVAIITTSHYGYFRPYRFYGHHW